MENRGSKSNSIKFVNEQRVDGSLLFNPLGGLNNIRCTLRGFEKISWAGIPSNIILNKRLYSSKGSLSLKKSVQLSDACSKKSTSVNSLNPWFVSGFTDGDGSFTVSITKKKSGIGWKIVPIFTIGLDHKDLDLLVQLKSFFKIGQIYSSKRGIVYYTVGSMKDIIKYILPHFDKYPLATLKLKDYLLFKEIVLLMEKGEHKSLPGLFKIFSLKASLNKGLPEIVKSEYPDIIPATKSELNLPSVAQALNPNWLSGFITAEGSFFISIYANDKRKAGYAVSLVFSLSQHIKDAELLKRLENFLVCGRIQVHSNRQTVEWIITKSDDLNQKLIPFLTKYALSGVKLLDFYRFKEASFLIENKMHLTPSGVKVIQEIKDAMYTR